MGTVIRGKLKPADALLSRELSKVRGVSVGVIDGDDFPARVAIAVTANSGTSIPAESMPPRAALRFAWAMVRAAMRAAWMNWRAARA